MRLVVDTVSLHWISVHSSRIQGNHTNQRRRAISLSHYFSLGLLKLKCYPSLRHRRSVSSPRLPQVSCQGCMPPLANDNPPITISRCCDPGIKWLQRHRPSAPRCQCERQKGQDESDASSFILLSKHNTHSELRVYTAREIATETYTASNTQKRRERQPEKAE